MGAFIAGFFVGGFAGMLVMGLANAARSGDDDSERIYQGMGRKPRPTSNRPPAPRGQGGAG